MDSKKINWTVEQVKLFGTAPDREIAKVLGRKTMTVAGARASRSIPAYRSQKRWTDGEIAMLGTMSDQALAAKFGRSRKSVALARLARGVTSFVQPSELHSRWPEVERAYTERGMSMRQIAAKHQVSDSVIRKHLVRRGLLKLKAVG